MALDLQTAANWAQIVSIPLALYGAYHLFRDARRRSAKPNLQLDTWFDAFHVDKEFKPIDCSLNVRVINHGDLPVTISNVGLVRLERKRFRKPITKSGTYTWFVVGKKIVNEWTIPARQQETFKLWYKHYIPRGERDKFRVGDCNTITLMDHCHNHYEVQSEREIWKFADAIDDLVANPPPRFPELEFSK